MLFIASLLCFPNTSRAENHQIFEPNDCLLQYNRNYGVKKLTPDANSPTRVLTHLKGEKFLVKYKWIDPKVSGTEIHTIEENLHAPNDELCDKCLNEQKLNKQKYCGDDCVGYVKVPCDKSFKILF